MKKFLSLLLVLIMSASFSVCAEESVPVEKIGTGEESYILQAGVISTADIYEGKGVEVGDQFLVDFVTSVPAFLTAGIYGSFDTEKAQIIAPVYSNSDFAVLVNQFDNEKGSFRIEGYDQKIKGIEEKIVFSILFEATAEGDFTINLSEDCLLGKPDENAFYEINVSDMKLTISENTDDESVKIIEEPEPLTPYDDMLGYDWAEKAVGVMYEIGVLENIADKSYYPGQNVTRGEFITMLMRVCKQEKNPSLTEPFMDISSDNYQYQAIMTAKVLGIAKGDENGNFRPDENITRQDICALVFRTMLKMNKARSEIEAQDYIGKFTDKDEISSYATDSVAGLIRAKLIIGDDNGLLRPLDNMTRAEAAVLLNRLAEYNILISM